MICHYAPHNLSLLPLPPLLCPHTVQTNPSPTLLSPPMQSVQQKLPPPLPLQWVFLSGCSDCTIVVGAVGRILRMDRCDRVQV